MKKKVIKFAIFFLIVKEIIPLNEEYLLIVSFMIFIYLFYKLLINFFYNIFSEETMFLGIIFEEIYFAQKKSFNSLAKIFKKSVRLLDHCKNFNKYDNKNLRATNFKSYTEFLNLSHKNKIKFSVVADWAVFDLMVWLLIEETLFYQDRLLKNIDYLAEQMMA